MAKRTISPEPGSAQAKSSFRTLKVRKGYYDHQYSRKHSYRLPDPVPWIQVKGYWLNQAGFTVGSQLSVQIQDGCITLRVQTSSNQ